MTNIVLPSFWVEAIRGNVNLLTDDIVVVGLDVTYTGPAGDKFLSDINSGAIVATSEVLTSPTVSDAGVFDADSAVFEDVAISGDVIKSLAIVKATGVAATSLIIAHLTTGVNGVALSAAPNGENITVVWPTEGIFGP